MHEFERRLQQCLDALPGLSAGRRQRLSRPLRQADTRLTADVDAVGMADALKAAVRTLLHETVDGVLLRLEGALDACHGAHAQALLAALAVHAAAAGYGLRFRIGGDDIDCGLRGATACTIEPLDPRGPLARLAVALEVAGSPAGAVARVVTVCGCELDERKESTHEGEVAFTTVEVEDDPFRCAAVVFERFGKVTAAAGDA